MMFNYQLGQFQFKVEFSLYNKIKQICKHVPMNESYKDVLQIWGLKAQKV